ncbi:hypothetical protein LXA43DRAFT_1062230 [Ganoderma leucocontextum]|nr:hypothetical protein LXA43DRAFT_1062230 [Ganoderma leucocontextum]
MVAFTARFGLLAALSSIAAVTVLPAPVRGGLVNADPQDLGTSIAARHSEHRTAVKAAVDDADSGDNGNTKHGRNHHKSSGVEGDAPSDSSEAKHQRRPKTTVPLPASLVGQGEKAGSISGKQGKKKGERTRTHRPGSKEKHAKQAREVYSIDPVTRMRSLWVGGGVAVRDVQPETLPPRVDKRHHDHHHHDHHDHHGHGPDKVIVKGDDDDVHIHHRSLGLVAPPGQASDPDLDHVVIEGKNDHVHIHDRHRGHDHDTVVVKGNDHHVHVHRAPVPYHHHHHHPDTVVVKGDNDRVHVHREPSPYHPHHHHRPEKVIIDGDNDHLHLRRSVVPHARLRSNVAHDSQGHVRVQRSPGPHHHHHHGEVTVRGGHDGVHIHHRTPHRRHHHLKAVVEGDNQHVHLGRSPVASPEPHHHHHRPDKVVVNGDHDHVYVHGKRSRDHRHPIVIAGNRGKAYLIPHLGTDSPVSAFASARIHTRRDGQIDGVPGTIEIMSQDTDSKETRIASLVVATPSNGTTVAGSPFVLNASDTDRTQMYMVPLEFDFEYTLGPSCSSIGRLPCSSPGWLYTAVDWLTCGSTGQLYIAVNGVNQRSLFEPSRFRQGSAKLESYCATFDPRPPSPAPMTVERCMANPSSSDLHKSQVFAYEPYTGIIRPMWYEDEDDGTSSDDPAPSAPSAPNGAPSAPSDPPSAPGGPPAAPSPPAGTSSGPPSPPVNSSTPVSNNVPAVTSFEQEALEGEFGDSTHSPMSVPKMFAAEALQNARNVTLKFAPTTPEVLPNAPVGKVAERPVVTLSLNPPETMSPATGSAATDSGSLSATRSTSSSSAVDSAAPTASTTADASATDPGASSAVTEQASATPSDAGSGDSSSTMTVKDLLMAATPSQTLEVKVYNVDASDTAADGPSGSGLTAAATPSSNGTDLGSSMMPTMTPVSTAPYEWMFKETTASS